VAWPFAIGRPLAATGDAPTAGNRADVQADSNVEPPGVRLNEDAAKLPVVDEDVVGPLDRDLPNAEGRNKIGDAVARTERDYRRVGVAGIKDPASANREGRQE
jgi:hypothetical protein